MTNMPGLETIMNPPQRVQTLRSGIDTLTRGAEPLVDLFRPYVDGLENLPPDGRFLVVGNHTVSGVEGTFIPHVVRRAIGTRVRPLTERMMGELPRPVRDVLAAYGAVIGSPDNARELMRHAQTILVFPGGGREIAKFKGEEYRLRWEGRAGFARLAVENDYPIVPAALVGGDDVYRSPIARDSVLGRLSLKLGEKLTDRRDSPPPLMHGIGPTLIPRPQRMYLRFAAPIQTTAPATDGDWVATVKSRTQRALETALAELRDLRSHDPYRRLNPLAWHSALQAR
ncbi:acyltransferase family protein [Mycobacterium sp. M1]|uniref:Acyltransferase family protein n=1 Tax=Mycolicibacter acidiphilus TaxID=2835306 RepID=A0ABS5RHL8_9MYCO|nr:lysophospholipid acyltransferase family protein [Mycolicibacter acidiphilus]MBS9533684.1 acyltransferase family protein [Mycolicibacter acidiphilus]